MVVRHAPRRIVRRDTNEASIVDTLESFPGVVVRKGQDYDLRVRRSSWIPGSWLLFEVKDEHTPIRAHQQTMIDRGETILVRSAREILERIGVNT